MRHQNLPTFAWVMAILLMASQKATACAVCFGDPNASMTKAVGSGILFLLVVVVGMLGALAGFFIFIARRASRASVPEEAWPQTAPADQAVAR